mmetsp:Transcript_8979/g.13089  ORF Transcript_8979/g.13089 Transcript_8979/m.13089 type:complete len:125 (-) Transcript_8979:368-742(-)
MTVTSLSDLSDSQKQELVASLSALLVGSAGGEVNSETLTAVATASGNDLSAAWAALFASVVDKAGGIDKFCAAPGGGGGGSCGGGGGGGEAAAAVEEKEEEEEEEADIGGGMDMFGGDGDDGGY